MEVTEQVCAANTQDASSEKVLAKNWIGIFDVFATEIQALKEAMTRLVDNPTADAFEITTEILDDIDEGMDYLQDVIDTVVENSSFKDLALKTKTGKKSKPKSKPKPESKKSPEAEMKQIKARVSAEEKEAKAKAKQEAKEAKAKERAEKAAARLAKKQAIAKDSDSNSSSEQKVKRRKKSKSKSSSEESTSSVEST